MSIILQIRDMGQSVQAYLLRLVEREARLLQNVLASERIAPNNQGLFLTQVPGALKPVSGIDERPGQAEQFDRLGGRNQSRRIVHSVFG